MEIGLRGKDLGELERLLGLFEAGKLSGALTVARLLLVSRDVTSIERWLEARVAAGPRNELLFLIEQHRHGCQCVAALREAHLAEGKRESALREAPGSSASDPAALANAELTERATRELVERFETWGLLGAGRDTLEIGCGAGRLQAALSPKVGLAAGVDASPEMVARARWCCSRLPNTRHEVGHGSDLGAFSDASFQLVYAVDAFPSLPAPDARTASPFAEAARVLAPAGELVFLLRPSAADAGAYDVPGMARSQGLEVVAKEERAFQCWEAPAYRLRRRAYA